MAKIQFGPEARALGVGPEAPLVVYFIRSASTGAIKIGSSTQPKRRLVALQTAHDAELRLLGTTEHYTECELHRKFASIRLQGEWFKPESELLEFLDDLGIDTAQTPDVKDAADQAEKDMPAKPLESIAAVDARSDIIYAISCEVCSWKMSPRDARHRLGLGPARLEYLLKGNIDRFSFDELLILAERAGLDVKFTVTRRECSMT